MNSVEFILMKHFFRALCLFLSSWMSWMITVHYCKKYVFAAIQDHRALRAAKVVSSAFILSNKFSIEFVFERWPRIRWYRWSGWWTGSWRYTRSWWREWQARATRIARQAWHQWNTRWELSFILFIFQQKPTNHSFSPF